MANTTPVTSNNYSQADMIRVICEKTGLKISYHSHKIMRNGVYQVTYRYNNGTKWVKGSRFISTRDLAMVKISRMLQRAKEVSFSRFNVDGSAVTTTGHTCSMTQCSCPDYTGFYTSANQMFIDSRLVCKHTLAYASQVNQVKNLGEFRKILATV